MRKTLVFLVSLSSRYLQNRLHSPVIVPLYLEIGYPAVALRGLDTGMAQEILDGHQGSVSIEELRGHGVTQLVARHFEPCLAGILLQVPGGSR